MEPLKTKDVWESVSLVVRFIFISVRVCPLVRDLFLRDLFLRDFIFSDIISEFLFFRI